MYNIFLEKGGGHVPPHAPPPKSAPEYGQEWLTVSWNLLQVIPKSCSSAESQLMVSNMAMFLRVSDSFQNITAVVLKSCISSPQTLYNSSLTQEVARHGKISGPLQLNILQGFGTTYTRFQDHSSWMSIFLLAILHLYTCLFHNFFTWINKISILLLE